MQVEDIIIQLPSTIERKLFFMNYLKIYRTSLLDGEGWRTVLFVAGCNHRCKGCHNRQGWSQFHGKPFTSETKEFIYAQMNDLIDGITLSGGDPLFPGNREAITEFCREFKERCPNKTIWCYTGYLYEEVKDLEVMQYIDVLVDGEFELDKRDTTIPFRGSTNQRIINVKTGKEIYKLKENKDVQDGA